MFRTPEELRLDSTPLSFGKYRGSTPDLIAESDPQYLVWLYGNVKNKITCSFPLAKECGYIDLTGSDPSARDLPLHGSRPKTVMFDDIDDDIPF